MKSSGLNGQRFNIAVGKRPVFKDRLELRKIGGVVNRLVAAKRHIEFAALVETAKSIEASAIQIIEELRRFRALPFAIFDELIEATTVAVEKRLLILHLDSSFETPLQMSVKVYEVRIDVVQDRALGSQAQWRGESAAERFNVASGRMLLPKRREVWYQPTLASRPLQRRLQCRCI